MISNTAVINTSFSFDTIQKTIDESRDAGMTVRAIVIINPGNPTGQCLSETTLKKLAMFCIDNEIVLMADEVRPTAATVSVASSSSYCCERPELEHFSQVYQGNVYQDVRPFVSMHKVCRELPEPASSNLELVSFHSGSKGVLGECGLRGGYMVSLYFIQIRLTLTSVVLLCSCVHSHAIFLTALQHGFST